MNTAPRSTNQIKLTTIENDGIGPSYFSEQSIELSGEPLRMLSEQQAAKNFRLRTSSCDYQSGWHTAGDPTLLVILSGTVEIELRDGSAKRFQGGDMFVAQDYLQNDLKDNETHGHRARVVGDQELIALHIKLSKR